MKPDQAALRVESDQSHPRRRDGRIVRRHGSDPRRAQLRRRELRDQRPWAFAYQNCTTAGPPIRRRPSGPQQETGCGRMPDSRGRTRTRTRCRRENRCSPARRRSLARGARARQARGWQRDAHGSIAHCSPTRRDQRDDRRNQKGESQAGRMASVLPAAATISGDGVSPAARAACNGSPPGSAAAT